MMFYLIGATEERLSCVHLHQDASQRPHVDGQVIWHSQQNFRRSVKPALDVLIDLGKQDANEEFDCFHWILMLLFIFLQSPNKQIQSVRSVRPE